MHPHRVNIFDGADDDAVIGPVAHHLHLIFFPPDNRFFDQHLGGGRGVKAAFDDGDIFLAVIGNAPAGAAQGEGRANDCRQPDLFQAVCRLRQGVGNRRARGLQANVGHRLAEARAVLGLVDGVGIGADQLNAIALQNP